MSTDPEAKLFYGYVQQRPEELDEWDEWETSEDDEDDPSDKWASASYNTVEGCTVGIFGYDGHIHYYLAVEESVHSAEWDGVTRINDDQLVARPVQWDEALQRAAVLFGLDLGKSQPGWHLVSLYF